MSDIPIRLSQAWAPVPDAWKRAFTIALAVNFLVFFYGLAQYPLGNHDVGYLDGVSYVSGGAVGRWFSPFVYVLNGFLQIPVYIHTLAFVFQITAGMAAVLLWNKEATQSQLLAGALLVSLIPFVNDHYYYTWMAHIFPFSQLCMILSLTVSHKRGLLRLCIAAALVTCGFATYQSSVMTFAVVWCGLIVSSLLQSDTRSIRSVILDALRHLMPLALGATAYLCSLSIFTRFGLIKTGAYQFQLAASSLTERIVHTMQSAFAHLWVTQPYSPRFLKLILLALVILGSIALICEVLKRKQERRFAAIFLGIFTMILASKSQFLISASADYYNYRFASAGLSYVYLFFCCVLFSSSVRLLRQTGLACICLLVPVFAVNDLRAQEHRVHSNIHDFAVINRIIARIEALENFDPTKIYDIVQFGRTKAYIPPLFTPPPDKGGVSFVPVTVSQNWRPGFELSFLSRYLRFNHRLSEVDAESSGTAARAAGLAEGRKAFPHKNSVFIMDENVLVLILDETAVRLALQLANR